MDDPTKTTLGAEIEQAVVADGDVEGARIRHAIESRLFTSDTAPVTVGRYEIRGRLGTGGLGVVYDAYDPRLNRRIALKLLTVEGTTGVSVDKEQARLLREAQALARLSHPNVVGIYDAGIEQDQVYIAMERVEGVDLSSWLEDPHPIAEILNVFADAGRGLAAAHASGVVHRDFKPGNVIVGSDGRARVLDFGIARVGSVYDVPPDRLPTGNDADFSQDVTYAAIVGTPIYMAPEQHTMSPVDRRADIYAFCVALWQALYGVRPFSAPTTDALRDVKLAGPPRPPKEAPGGPVPSAVAELLQRGLQPLPERRPASMEDVLRALQPRRSVRRWIAGGAVTAAAVALAGVVIGRTTAVETDCNHVDVALAGIWDDDVKARAREAFSRTTLPYADAAWQRTSAMLDAYAQRWIALERRTCEEKAAGLPPQRTVDRRLCLDRRLTSFAELTRLMSAADAKVVENSMDAVTRLGSVSDCETPPSFDGPTEAERRRQAEQFDVPLARAEALTRAGKLDEAERLTRGALEHAIAMIHPADQARALRLLGRIEAERGNGDGAYELLHDALTLAEREADQQTAVRALIDLVHVVGRLQSRHEEALRFAELADAKIEQLGGRTELRYQLALSRGAVAGEAGMLKESKAAFEVAMKIARRSETIPAETRDYWRLRAGNALAVGHLRLGSYDEAAAAFEELIADTEAQLGSQHPTLAAALYNLAITRTTLGDHGECRRLGQRALAIQEALYGANSANVARTLDLLATCELELGEVEASLAYSERSLAIARELHGSDNVITQRARLNMARALAAAGEIDRAANEAEACLEAMARVLGDDHVDLSYAHLLLADIEEVRGNRAHQLDALETALKIREATLGADHPRTKSVRERLDEATVGPRSR